MLYPGAPDFPFLVTGPNPRDLQLAEGQRCLPSVTILRGAVRQCMRGSSAAFAEPIQGLSVSSSAFITSRIPDGIRRSFLDTDKRGATQAAGSISKRNIWIVWVESPLKGHDHSP